MSPAPASAVCPGATPAPTGPFDAGWYLRASAVHEGSEPVCVAAGGARLSLLRSQDGGLHTVYGYPEPVGETGPRALAALAERLAGVREPLRVALSPLGAGSALALRLRERLPVETERPICVLDLEGDPLQRVTRGARYEARRALRGGAVAHVGPVTLAFGGFYRAAMRKLGAEALYLFEDAYFEALRGPHAFQVCVRDPNGLAAAAVFLAAGGRASYHLSARRAAPAPVPGVSNLVLLEGVRECARRGSSACVLGGGRTAAPDDPLLRFKAGMASRVITRPTFREQR